MRRIKEILDSGQFRLKLEEELSAIVRGQSAKVKDHHDGTVYGSVTSFRVHRLKRGEPTLEEEHVGRCTFSAIGTAVVGYVNSEGQDGECEMDAHAEGDLRIVLDFSAFTEVNFDMGAAVNDSALFVEVQSVKQWEADSKPVLVQSAKPKFKALDVAPFELIPEGAVDRCDFGGTEVRRILHHHEWYFSVVDVISVLTDSPNPSRYWSQLKRELVDIEGSTQLFAKIEQLKLASTDGKHYKTDCASTEAVLRLIQSVKSPKAEPMKQWLARVGYERIQETQNPEIAIKRAVVTYQLQGRTPEWIEARLRSILTRKTLTDEWSRRGIKDGSQYGALTDVIAKATFDKTTNEHRLYKGLASFHNLRDNMTTMELIFMSLGEAATKEFAQRRDAQGYRENSQAAKSGGGVAGKARKDLEDQLGAPVVSTSNNLATSKPAMGLFEFPGKMKETMDEIAKLPPEPPKKRKRRKKPPEE